MGDGPRVVPDLEELVAKPNDWWQSQTRLTKISTANLKSTSLLQRKLYQFLDSNISSFLDLASFCFFRNIFPDLFLVILKLPDSKVAGLNRGEAVWLLLSRLLEEPFDAMGLVASRFRGKSKIFPLWEFFRVLQVE